MSNESLWLAIEDGSVLDQSGEPLIGLYNGSNAIQVEDYTYDITPPRLDSFTIDLNTGILMLTFSESVNALTINVTVLTLQNMKNNSLEDMFSFHDLSPPTRNWKYDIPQQRIYLSSDDLNELKRLYSLATFVNDTYISIESELIQDVYGIPVAEIDYENALRADYVTPDTNNPELVSFSLDLTAETLELTFNETVNASSLVVNAFTLQNDEESVNGSTESYTLSVNSHILGVDPSGQDSTVITIDLHTSDLNKIKEFSDLATSPDNTYLSVLNNGILDMNSNGLLEIPTTMAINVTEYFDDKIKPALADFELDMDLGLLTLNFDETVNGTSFMPEQVTLATNSNDSTTYVRLSGAKNYSLDYSTTIEVYILDKDLNEIKRLTNLAVDLNTTFISFTEDMVMDMNDNNINPEAARKAVNFINDTTRPELVAFDLNMTSDLLTLYFSETVSASSFDARMITFLNNQTNQEQWKLMYRGLLLSNDSTEMIMKLDNRDLNEIKIREHLSTDKTNTYLSVTTHLVSDMNDNMLKPISSNDPLDVSSFTQDHARPSLSTFDLDMDGSGVLHLTFSESVNVTSLDVTQITLASAQNIEADDFAEAYVIGSLGSGSISNNSNGPVVDILLHFDDINQLKILTMLAEGTSTTFISINESVIEDMNGNRVVEIPLTMADRVVNFTADRTHPILEQFSLDMNNGDLNLTFSEAVFGNTLNRTFITLYNDTYGEGSKFQLNLENVENLPIFYEITTKLTVIELNELKRISDLATSVNDTFISIKYNAITDTNNNELLPIYSNESLKASPVVPDNTQPELEYYYLDLNKGLLELTFDETVRSSSLNVTQITFQNDSQATDISYTLTEAAEWSVDDSTIITITLSHYDLNKIKQIRELCYDENSTFIVITSDTIEDMNMQQVVAILEDSALEATEYTEDMTEPELLSFDFNLNTEQIILTFTETVDTLTLRFNGFTLLGETSNVNYTLMEGSTPSDDWFIITLQLDIADVNNIKRNRELGVNYTTTRLIWEPVAIFDMNDNQLAIREPLNVTNYTADTIQPVLVSFDLDMDADQLVMTFNETMDINTLMILEIILQESENVSLSENSTLYYALKYSDVISLDDPVVNISLHPNDANAIKSFINIASRDNNTYLSLSSEFIRDMNYNELVEVPSSSARRVNTFIEDTTSPVLVSYELDLTAEELRFVFNETINVNTFDASVIVIESDTSQFTLSGGIIEYTTNNTNLTLQLKRADLNEIKKDESLAVSNETTLLTFDTSLLQDMNRNYIRSEIRKIPTAFYPDLARPELESYHLDMNEGVLYLSFSETVRVSTLAPQSFTLQNNQSLDSNDVTVYTIKYAEAIDDNSPIVVMQLSKLDQDNLKQLRDLSTNISDTFLTVTENGIKDMNNNSIISITSDDALQAENFTPDTNRPELIMYDMDMNNGNGVLWLTFNETMLISSLNVSQITLHSSDETINATSYTLTDGSTFEDGSYDDPVVAVVLSLFDSNEIKKLYDLATTEDNTFLTLSDDTITDMNYNQIIAIEAPEPVSNYTEDTTEPELISFVIDLNSNILTFQFSETVNVDTLNVEEITFQDSQNATEEDSVILTDSSYSNSLNSSVIEINIGTYDRNTLTALIYLYTERNDSFLSITSDTVMDMNNNTVIPLNYSEALIAAEYIPDVTNPSLLNFTVNMDKGTIHLFFNETVSLETIDYMKFHLYSDEFGSIEVNLTNGSYNEDYTHMPIVNMVRVDIDETKVTEYLWTNATNTWLYIEDGAILDWTMMNPVESNILVADEKPIENNGPILQTFAINITSGVITLNYDEPVRPDTIVYQRFMLHNAAVNYTMNYRLTGGTSSSENGRSVLIKMKSFDLNFVKSLTGLYTNENTTYLTLSPGAIRDMVLNPSVAINDKKVDVFIEDTNHPYLVTYQMDMDEGIMMLNFSETVDVSSFVLPLFVIQKYSNVSYDIETNYHRFSNMSTAMTSDHIELLDNKTVVIYIHLDDLNEIKRKRIASSEATTWLVIEEKALHDNNYRDVIELVNGITAKQAETYIRDTTSPELERFDISLDAGTIVFSFSETIDATTLNIDEITIQNSMFNPSEKYTLTNSSSLYPPAQIQFTSCIGLLPAVQSGSGYGSGSGSGDIFGGSNVMVEMDLETNESAMSNSTMIYSNSLSSFNFHEITIYLSHFDLNSIKALTGLATHRTRSFVSFTKTTVSDMVNNEVVEINNTNARMAFGYKYDDTMPEVVGFDLDVNSGNLTMTFTETVNVTSLDVTQITLQSNKGYFGSITAVYIFNSWPPYPNTSHSFSDDWPIIIIQIGHEDLNAIKKLRPLAVGRNSTYLSWTSLAIYDNDRNPVVTCMSSFAHEVSEFSPDVTRPELVSFDLDMNDGRLILTFSETVKVADSLDVTQITLYSQQEALNTALSEYTLTDNQPFASHSTDEDGHVVTILLSFTDSNAIKYRSDLATLKNNTFISITNLTVVDMEDLEVEEIFSYAGQMVRIHTPDETNPRLVNYTLDMDTTTLTLTFDETVNATSLDVTYISLQNGNSSSADYHSSPYNLTPGENETYTSSDNDYIIVIHLGPLDRNEIKRRQLLAINRETTWLTIDSKTIVDMNSNPVVDIHDGDALLAGDYIADDTPPVLVDFSIDMNRGRFVLTFDETVSAKTLQIDSLTLQDNSSYINSTYSLTNKGNSSGSDSTVITVDLDIVDLNEIKRLRICTEIEDCYMLHDFAAVIDLNTNAIELRDDGEGLVTFKHQPDVTDPVLIEFNTNLISETITMTFTETVDASSINFEAFTLQDFFVATTNYTLTNGRVQEDDSTVITFNFTWNDLNNIKRNTDLYVGRPSSWLTITEYAITDMALDPNYVVPVINDGDIGDSQVTWEFVPDTTRPELWDFDLDLTKHELTLYFSETVLAKSFDINQIELQNAVNSPTETVQLTMGSLPWLSHSFSTDNTTIIIQLGQYDTDRIKAFTDLATATTNTYITITSDTIKDMNNNNVIPIENDNAHIVQELTEDRVPPELLSFVLNLNTGLITLTFSETVETSSLEVSEITISSSSDSDIVSWTLTNMTEAISIVGYDDNDDDEYFSSASAFEEIDDFSGSGYFMAYSGNCTEDKSVFEPYHSFTPSKDLAIITLQLGFIDINELNKMTNLATNGNNTYIAMTRDAIMDMNENRVIEVPSHNSTEASIVYKDVTKPELVSYDLNLTSEYLLLTFNEVVNTDTFNVQYIVFQELANIHIATDNWYQLTGGKLSQNDDYIVNVRLDTADLNQVKKITQLLTEPSNTFITFSEELIQDMHKNNVVAEVNGKATRVSCFTQDIVRPVLVDFHLDMNEGELFLTFSETVHAGSFDVTQIGLQDDTKDLNERMRQLTNASYDIFEMDSTVITVKLGYADLNRIKFLPEFGLSTDDTFITITDDLINDMNYNPVVEISDGEAQSATNFTKDVTSPKLRNFHLDFINEKMTLHFDEPISTDLINYTAITLQDGFTSIHSYTLTKGTPESFDDGLTVVITFDTADINYLKTHPSLTTSISDSYITFTSDAFYDTATKPNPVVPLIDNSTAKMVSTFTYYPPPEFVSVRPRAARASGGTVLTIEGNNFGPLEGEKGSRQVQVFLDFVSQDTEVIIPNTTLEVVTGLANESIIGVPIVLTITVDDSALMINITDEFIFLAPPTINRIYPTVGTFMGDTLVTIYGENFGYSTVSGEGPEVSVTIGGENCTDVNVLSNYTLTCYTPELTPEAYSVIVTVDEVPSAIFADAFIALYPATADDIEPISMYRDTPVLVTITGSDFGPTTSSNDSTPLQVFFTTDEGISDCTNVTVTVNDQVLTCLAQPNIGPANITIIVDEVDSMMSDVVFFFHDNAGNFSFKVKNFYVSERELFANVTVVRHDYPEFASPANVSIQALDGTATSPYYFIATNITKWIPYPQNSITFAIRITAIDYEPERIRKGTDDDRYLKLKITSVDPLHGTAVIADPNSTLTIKGICNAVTHACVADWDVETNSIVYYRIDEIP